MNRTQYAFIKGNDIHNFPFEKTANQRIKSQLMVIESFKVSEDIYLRLLLSSTRNLKQYETG